MKLSTRDGGESIARRESADRIGPIAIAPAGFLAQAAGVFGPVIWSVGTWTGKTGRDPIWPADSGFGYTLPEH